MHDTTDNFPIALRLYAAPMHRNERFQRRPLPVIQPEFVGQLICSYQLRSLNPTRPRRGKKINWVLSLVPSEHSTGPKRRIGAITKAGDVHARTLLIEAAHCYRFPARIARHKLAAVDAVPEDVRVVAWKAQTRLSQRYRRMMAKGKPRQVVVTAIARELAGFVWAIACITSDPPAKTSAVAPASEDARPINHPTTIVPLRNGSQWHNEVAGPGIRQTHARQGRPAMPDEMIGSLHSTG